MLTEELIKYCLCHLQKQTSASAVSLFCCGIEECCSQTLPTAVHQKPGEIPSLQPPPLSHPPTPSSVIHILTLTFMEPLDRGEAEYMEPGKRCRRGGESADKAWWKKVEWSGWAGGRAVALKVARHCAEKERSIIRLHNYFLGHKVDIIDPEWETLLALTPSHLLEDLTSSFWQQHLEGWRFLRAAA